MWLIYASIVVGTLCISSILIGALAVVLAPWVDHIEQRQQERDAERNTR